MFSKRKYTFIMKYQSWTICVKYILESILTVPTKRLFIGRLFYLKYLHLTKQQSRTDVNNLTWITGLSLFVNTQHSQLKLLLNTCLLIFAFKLLFSCLNTTKHFRQIPYWNKTAFKQRTHANSSSPIIITVFRCGNL